MSSSVGWAAGSSGTLLKTTNGGSTWLALDPRTTNDLDGVAFTDGNNGWLAGTAGTMMHTTDGGSTWTTQTVPAAAVGRTLRSVSFWSSSIGVAVGDVGVSTSTILFTNDGGATWRSAATTCTAGLTSVQMVSATTGWAVGGAGTLLKTTDGGATWAIQPAPTSAGLTGVSFAPGGSVGYIVGNAVLPSWTIYKTTDGGATWTAVNGLGATGAINLTSVYCLDANNAVTVGFNGQVRHTTDGGATWSNQSINNVGSNGLRAITMLDAKNMRAVGDVGMIFMTADSGNFWTTPAAGSAATYESTCFVDSLHGWAVGTNGTVVRTTDGGASWTTVASGITVWRGVYFASTLTGWIVGDGGAIERTNDGGVTWVPQSSGTSSQLNGVCFTSTTTGIAVGNSGTILRTTNGGTNWSSRASGVTANLNAIYYPAGNTAFAAGDAGTIVRSTNGGSTWSSQTSNAGGQNLLTIRGSSASAVWAAGNGGTMVRTTNGSSWSAVAPGAGTNPIRTVFFANSTTGWYASTYGLVKKTTDGGSTWTQENAALPTSPTDAATGLWSLWFADANTGYLVGDGATIRKTTDGGATWSSQQYGTQVSLLAGDFTDANNGWISGTGGFMLHTTNGGTSWFAEKTGTGSALNGVSMVTSSTGWAVGDNGAVRRTTDGGATWTGQNVGISSNLKSVSTVDGVHVIIAGSGALKYTSNTGSTWTSASVAPTQPVSAMVSVSATEAFAVTTRLAGNNFVWHTLDGGSTWTTQTTTANANLWSITFVSPTTGFACGDTGAILKTTDSGTTWIKLTTPTTQALYSISFLDALNGVAVGANGTVLRTADGGTTWTPQSSGTSRTLSAATWTSGGVAYLAGASGALLSSANTPGPTTSIFLTPSSPDGTNGWYVSDPSIQLLPDRVSSTFYSWISPAGPFTLATSSFLATSGPSTLYYYSVDTSGNAEPVKNTSLLVDYAAPSAPGTPVASAVATSSLQLTWPDGADTISGVDHYAIVVNGALSTSTSDASTSTLVTGLAPRTSYSAIVKTVDVAGNVSASSTPVSFTTADDTPLVTSSTIVPASPNGQNSWYVTTPTVTLASTPATVSAYTRYAWDASALATYTAPLAVPAAGAHTLSFWSADVAGMRQQEPTQTLSLKLDSTSPTSPSTITASGVATNALSVSWSGASDPQSGVDHYDLWVGGLKYGTYTTTSAMVTGRSVNTTYTVYVVTVNAAGLSSVSATTYGHTWSNPTVSTVSTTSPSSPDGTHGWYVSSPTISLASLPTTIPAWIYYAWDGNAATTYVPGSQLPMPGDGSHTLAFCSADKNDPTNRETTQTITLKRDTAAPSPPAATSAGSLDTTSIVVSWTLGADLTSGVDHYKLYMDGAVATSTPATGAVVTGLTPNSIHNFWVTAIDGAGNESSASPTAVGISASNGPLLTYASPSPSGADGTNGWFVTTPTISFSVAPAVPAWTYYAWDGSAMTTVTGGIAPPTDGMHTLAFWSIDQLGWRSAEATQMLIYKLDTSVPSAPGSPLASGDSTHSIAVSWSAASDAQSGIDHYEIYVNGTLKTSVPGTATSAIADGLAVNHTYSVVVTAVNGAGLAHASDTVSAATFADPQISTVASITPLVPDGANGWYTSAPSIALSSLPSSLGGITYYRFDSAPATAYAAPVSPSGDGTHTLEFHSVDPADTTNRDETAALVFHVDSAAPTPPTSLVAATIDTTSVALAWNLGVDATSGLDHYAVYADGVAWGASVTSTGTTVTGLTPNRVHSFYVVAVDRAGNASAPSTAVYAATGAVSPLTTTANVTPATPDGLASWYVSTPTITFSALPSEPAWTVYAWDGSAPATATGPIQMPSTGTHTLSYWSVDQAGLRAAEPTKTLTLNLDSSPDVRATPGAPKAMVAATTSVTYNSANLIWSPAATPPSGFDHYEIWDEFVGSTSGLTYSIGGLSPSTTYGFTIYAVNHAGTYYSQSDTVTVNTSASPLPAAPAYVLARAPAEGYAYINWTPSTDTIGSASYRIYRSSDGATYSAIATTTGGLLGNTFVDTGLSSSTRYYYAVSTLDDRGESALSSHDASSWPVTAPITGPPSRVQGLTAFKGDKHVLLTWQPSNDPTIFGYYVLRAPRSLAASSTVTTLTLSPITSTGFDDNTAVNGEPYYYSVVAVDTSGTIGRPSLEVEGRAQRTYSDELSPHDDSQETPSACICHANHANAGGLDAAGNSELIRFPKTNADTVCETCHPPASSAGEFLDPLAVSKHAEGSSVTTQTPFTCNTCHVPLKHSNEATANLLRTNGEWACTSVTGTPPGDGFCYSCHGKGSTLPEGDLTGFENSGHVNVNAPATGANVKCDTCHESHSSRNEHLNRYSGFMMCMQCHTASSVNPNEPDIWDRLQLNEDANAKHPLLPQDQVNGARMTCQNCHNTHSVTSANPLVDPHNPSPSGAWTTPRTDEKAFCFTCHDGNALPTSAETTPWAGAVLASNGATSVTDIKDAYQVNVHGLGLPSNPTTTNAFLRPDMGYTYNTVLECRSCHDPHGTPNSYALQQTVTSANGSKSVSGVIVGTVPGGGYDLRFFCSTCHLFDPSTHDSMANTSTVSFPTDCTRCHRHVKNDKTPSNRL